MPGRVNVLRYYIASHNIIIGSCRPNRVFILKGSTYYISFNLINLGTNLTKKLSTDYALRRSRSKIFLSYLSFLNCYIVLKYYLRL
jgi:hypothetical protein